MPFGHIMANIMTDIIKNKVSKRKRRFVQGGFNLDLTYILPNLIAMGVPAEKIETVYRNNITDVSRFFETNHKEVYKIYNLCAEREYDIKKFHSRVAIYPFQDHNPPNFEQIEVFCRDVHNWLSSNSNNIAAVHCKAGKGRTGTMICCYLLYKETFTKSEDALRFFGERRSHDHKGVTIPSQRRYVDYYARFLNSGKIYTPIPVQITKIKLSSTTILNSHQRIVHFSISYLRDTMEHHAYTEKVPDVKKSTNTDGCFVIDLDQCIPLAGDIKVEFFVKSKVMMRNRKPLFRFWFNSFFVADGKDVNSENKNLELTLTKNELDYVYKDVKNKLCPLDFKVAVSLQITPSGAYVRRSNQNLHHNNHHSNTSMNSLPDAHTPSESPEASSSDSSAGECWESGECTHISSGDIERPKQRKINIKQKLVKSNLNAAKQPQQFFKMKTKTKINYFKSTNNNNNGGVHKKMRWLSSMCGNPEFNESLAQTVNIRAVRKSIDSLNFDYYSAVCDNQLSVVGSPPNNNCSGNNINFKKSAGQRRPDTTFDQLSSLSSSSSTSSASSSSTLSSASLMVVQIQKQIPSPPPQQPLSSSSFTSIVLSECRQPLDVAKPKESQSIGFNIGDSNNIELASEKLPCDSLCSNVSDKNFLHSQNRSSSLSSSGRLSASKEINGSLQRRSSMLLEPLLIHGDKVNYNDNNSAGGDNNIGLDSLSQTVNCTVKYKPSLKQRLFNYKNISSQSQQPPLHQNTTISIINSVANKIAAAETLSAATITTTSKVECSLVDMEENHRNVVIVPNLCVSPVVPHILKYSVYNFEEFQKELQSTAAAQDGILPHKK